MLPCGRRSARHLFMSHRLPFRHHIPKRLERNHEIPIRPSSRRLPTFIPMQLELPLKYPRLPCLSLSPNQRRRFPLRTRPPKGQNRQPLLKLWQVAISSKHRRPPVRHRHNRYWPRRLHLIRSRDQQPRRHRTLNRRPTLRRHRQPFLRILRQPPSACRNRNNAPSLHQSRWSSRSTVRARDRPHLRHWPQQNLRPNPSYQHPCRAIHTRVSRNEQRTNRSRHRPRLPRLPYPVKPASAVLPCRQHHPPERQAKTRCPWFTERNKHPQPPS